MFFSPFEYGENVPQNLNSNLPTMASFGHEDPRSHIFLRLSQLSRTLVTEAACCFTHQSRQSVEVG